MREMKHRKPLDPSSYLCFNYFSPSPQLLHDLMRRMTRRYQPAPAGARHPLVPSVR